MATGCLDRIQKFLLSESRLDQRISIAGLIREPSHAPQMQEDAIELLDLSRNVEAPLAVMVENASIPPSPGSPAVLSGVNLQIEAGSLTMVVGIVGAGKTTLLKAILGELNCTSGTIKTSNQHSAYCAQTPWLPNLTVRQIICGYRHHDDRMEDEEWYNAVLYACAIDEDLLLFPEHDNTIIGSRGVTLSGGQKQRLVVQSCHRNWYLLTFDRP